MCPLQTEEEMKHPSAVVVFHPPPPTHHPSKPGGFKKETGIYLFIDIWLPVEGLQKQKQTLGVVSQIVYFLFLSEVSVMNFTAV